MVKRTFLLIAVFLLGLGVALYFINKDEDKGFPSSPKSTEQVLKFDPDKVEKKNSIFVPSWTLTPDTQLSGYDRYIYFGVAPGFGGINESEQGFLSLEDFLNSVPGNSEKYLTLRMNNSDQSLSILSDENQQEEVIESTIELARSNNFQGVVLDLELFSLFNDRVPIQINNFVKRFSTATRVSNLKFSVAIYGDVFFRKRPFDVKEIANNSDEIMIMAYDFHKPNGEPGPNFPLRGKEQYRYDMETMIGDFLSVAPREKLTVIFGMYGYDWTVDEKKRPIKAAEVLTDKEIENKYLTDCKNTNCLKKNDQLSQETEIEYVEAPGRIDEFSRNHIIWYENIDSVKSKQQFLLESGIGDFAYWANSYF